MALYEITTEPTELNFDCTTADNMIERTLRNAKNLIMLRKGELPYDRLRGLDPAIFDLPYMEAEEALIPELERAMLWEPDAEVEDGWLDINEENETVIHCVVKINTGEEEQ